MKRKRGNSDHLSQSPRPPKRHPEQVKFVNIPALKNDNPVTSTPVFTGSERSMTHDSDRIQNRTDRMDWQHVQREPQDSLSQATRVNEHILPSTESQNLNELPTMRRPSTTRLKETIEAQFSLEILLKHKELRLIDQEIAKCQIALEQLRRCHVIPYPAMSSDIGDMQAAADGVGQVYESAAPYPPPWGVANGPYTRHYQCWLIPDPAFGDAVEDPQLAGSSKTETERSGRAPTSGKSSMATKSRSQRSSGNSRLKALPHGYPETKEDKGPMILKRSTDGQMVKLVCLDCRRSDFNSAQGFINHCRIAHSRNFQSHDAAAIACGEEVELDQAGGVVGEQNSSSNNGVLVHPLIRSAHAIKSTPHTPANTDPIRSQLSGSGGAAGKSPIPSLTSLRGGDLIGNTLTPLKPSPQTPHLSALFAKLGKGGDLDEEVSLATVRSDFDLQELSGDDEDDQDAEEELNTIGPASHSTRGVVRSDCPPVRATMSPAPLHFSPSVNLTKPEPRKPRILTHLAPQPTYPSYNLSGDVRQTSNGGAALQRENSSPNLSPNTVESHQAPSLVSDDDDYENTHSECSSSAGVDDEDMGEHYLDMGFEEHHEDQELEELGGLTATSKGSHHHPVRRSSALRSPDAVRSTTVGSDRRVSFASSVRRPRKKGGK